MSRRTSPKTAAGFTERLARSSATHPWRTVGIWATIIVVAVLSVSSLLGSALTSESKQHGKQPDSTIGLGLIQDRMTGPQKLSEFVIVRSTTRTVDDPMYEAYVKSLAGEISSMQCLARLGSDFHPQVSGFRRKLDPLLDIKQGALLPIQNLARYHAFARGITIQATLDRLAAVCKIDADGAECDRTLREAYLTLKQLQLEHHAEAVQAGRKPDNTIDTRALRPLTRANLQEALRAVAAAQ